MSTRMTLCCALFAPLSAVVLSPRQKAVGFVPSGVRPIIRDAGRLPISRLDLYWGPAAQERQPAQIADFGGFEFKREKTNGTNPKFQVTDAKGKLWRVKLPFPSRHIDEPHAETVASRFMWAMGYFADEIYFRSGILVRVAPTRFPRHSRVAKYFKKVRGSKDLYCFRGPVSLKPEETADEVDGKDLGLPTTWSFDDSKLPFYHSKEYDVMQICLALIGHWDNVPGNNRILYVRRPNGEIEAHCYVSDLGQTFGRTETNPGWDYTWRQVTNIFFPMVDVSQWNPSDYERAPFVSHVTADKVYFHYTSKRTHSRAVRKQFREATIHAARLAAARLGELSDHQIDEMFAAAQTPPDQAYRFKRALRKKIDELDAAVTDQRAVRF